MDVPAKSADKSDWVNYAMSTHDVASYDAWAMTEDELHALAPAPPEPPKTAAKTTRAKGDSNG